jgi:electron transfer flavoprotein alpha subunit
MNQMTDAKNRCLVVIAEQHASVPSAVTFEMIFLAGELGELLSLETRVVVLGDGSVQAAEAIADRTGARVSAVENPHLKLYNGEMYQGILHDVLKKWAPAMVFGAHTTQGLDFIPGLAVRMGAACISGVERYENVDGHIHFRRTILGGKFETRVRSKAVTTVITVQPGSFKIPEKTGFAPKTRDVDVIPSRMNAVKSRTMGHRRIREANAVISKADTIIAAGRGVGKKENLPWLERLAELFPRSAVAGSRPVCDAGWLDYSRQVGLTGATVNPKLYIACGISGARQHTVGMQGSGFIVAISTDPHAAMFNLADVVVVEEVTTFIAALIEVCT